MPMSPLSAPTPPAAAIEAYLRGKDGNRPHLLRAAFTDAARLVMQVNTTGIAFPAGAIGRAEIADVLVRRFNQAWENITTLCIGEPPAADAAAFTCDWFVAMSGKQDGGVRAGCGRYDWVFDRRSGLACSLTIVIDAMVSVPVDVDTMADWASALPYPWCGAPRLARGAPDVAALRAVLQRLHPAGRS